MEEREVRYYSSYTDDFEVTSNQNFKLPEDYKWVRRDLKSKFLSGLIYGTAIIFSSVYCRLFLHMKIKGRKNVKGIKDGYYIYGNHTQPFGDVFIPALCVLPKRIYTVVSTANYGIPFICKIIPFLGGLPIVDSVKGIKELSKAMEYHLNNGHPVVIYPEAHVWEYYTGIRPFPDTSFKFPVKFNKPAFAMTVTYKKSKIFKRPVMEVFVDGPFYGNGESAREKASDLHKTIFDVMNNRSKNSNLEYIKYVKKAKNL